MAGSPQTFERVYPATVDEVHAALRSVIEAARHKDPRYDDLTHTATWRERRPTMGAYPHNWVAQTVEWGSGTALRLTGSLARTLIGGDPWAQPAAERVYAAVSERLAAMRAA